MAVIATVSPTELIRSTWGNSVANELNNACVKADGSRAMTGPLIITASPGLRLRRTGDTPFLQFENTTGATRFGYVQGQSTQMIYAMDNAAGSHRFLVDGTERLEVNSAGVDVTGTLTADAFTTTSVSKFGGNGGQIQLIDTSTSGSDFHDVYMAFYGAGVSMVSPGARTGYVGFGGTTTLQLKNEVANGGVALTGNGAGTVALVTGSSGDITATTGTGGNIILNSGGAGVIVFTANGAERGRINTGQFMWGKTTSGTSTNGVELTGGGLITSTTATNATPNLYLRHNTDADLVAFAQFANAAGGILSEIQQDNVAPVGIKITSCAVTAPSDYRLKNELGPVADALDRVLQLQPKHLAWKETSHEFDGFIAHEVAAVVPDAVTGDKDDVYTADEAERMGVQAGDIKAQQLDQIPLIPLLTAAIQELAARVEALG